MRTRIGCSRWGRVLVAAGVMALPLAGPAAAQTTTGNIRGYVRSTAGEALAGATVTARQLETNLQRGALTSATGQYYLGGLRPGHWVLTVQMLGYGNRADTVQLLVGQTLDVNVTLATEAVALEGITVTAPAAQETRSQAIVTNVTRDAITNLPTRDRNILDLAGLAPGVQVSRSTNGEKTFKAGAQPAEQVNVFVDGASYKNDVLRNGVAGQDASKGNPFPQSAIEEFRVLTQNFKAEYQMAGSAIITAVTRSGTNEWEANAYGYNICVGCVAKDAIAVQQKLKGPDFHRFQAGGAIGGPIKRDRAFFFGTYEYNDRSSPVSVIPGSGPPIPGVDLNQYRGQFENRFKEHLAFGKLTLTPGSRHTIDISTNYRKEDDVAGFGGTTAYTHREDVAQDIVTSAANYKYAADRWLNEAQISFQNYKWQPHPIGSGVVKDYAGVIVIGPKESQQTFQQRRVSLRDDITLTGLAAAGHAVKFGANVDFLRYEAEKYFSMNPVLHYEQNISFAQPAWARVGYGDPGVAANNVQLGAYIQDDWAITPKLQLNLGIRWDAETNAYNNTYVTPQAIVDSLTGPLASKLDQQVLARYPLANYISKGRSSRPIYLKAFQPRLGFSYDVTGDNRNVVFGGAGLYYDRNFWNLFFDEYWRRQFQERNVCFQPGPDWCTPQVPWNDSYYTNPEAIRQLAQTKGTGVDVFMVSNKTVPPRTLQFTAGYRRAFGENVLATVSYAGARGYHLLNWVRGNSDWGNIGPSYGNLLLSTSDAKTFYDSFILQIERPFRATSRWGGSLAYTLGWAKSQGSTDCCFPFLFDFRYKIPENMPKLPIPGDNRHQIVASGIARIPYDFLLSGILTLRSGAAIQGNDYSHLTSHDDMKAVPYAFYPPKRTFLGIPHAFAEQYFDMRLEKGVTLASGNRVALQVDLFNVFNAPNYGCFNVEIPPQGSTNANYGVPSCAGEARRVQFGLRYDLSTANRSAAER
ncbi:MAG: TonB-dependent receptor [Gemmatimonadetes bacterium]|nr:TonB-dependent receptor [Gemmatimonadota bacterium]